MRIDSSKSNGVAKNVSMSVFQVVVHRSQLVKAKLTTVNIGRSFYD